MMPGGEVLEWLKQAAETYVLPYWGWIVVAVLGLFAARWAWRKLRSKIAAMLFAGLGGGAALGGAVDWVSSRF